MIGNKMRQRIAIAFGLSLAIGASAALASAEETTTAPAKIAGASPKVQLSVEKFNAILKAEEKINQLAQKDPSLKQLLSTKPQDKNSASEWIRKVEAQPQIVTAFREAGLTPREYLVTVGALMRAANLADQRRRHQGLSKELVDSVPPEHLAFVEANQDVVDNWQMRSQKTANKVNTLEDLYAAPVDAAPGATATAAKPSPAPPPKSHDSSKP